MTNFMLVEKSVGSYKTCSERANRRHMASYKRNNRYTHFKDDVADDVNSEEFVMTKDEFSGADIKAICTEAGLLALRA
jgi:ATP-dependent 26S proteasome regulatory subunit